jgi:UDP-GlcNAc:undecaprenyl-phosphate GlcNAc-1-phosphate transferase
MILILGLIDDFGALTAFIKFLGQFLAAFILYKSGIKIQWDILPDEVNLILTLIWIVGICNAFNIIDIMDGLAAGVTVISSVFLFIMVVLKGNSTVIAVMTLALAGAVLGFLRYNFKPAKIYMGDTGSMFIGLMMGSLTMMVSYGNSNRLALLAPLFVLGVPIFDTLFVMVHRLKRGMSVFKGSPDHFALRLKKMTGSVRRTVIITYAATLVLCITGLVLIFLPGFILPAVLISTMATVCVVAGVYLSTKV